ncbi:hypothetical protein [Deinococcus cellulosilyticus]|uniref:Uncharacterized protein n=1 Tax=Deinococcus cellulosilyticus (strain DSM 18568 / NBRC 106333 / KACC 11606 / 5516J-15) TaxID=1223518 RepID=A0A511N147_DEIC1|nr:hypothetical protein [Deinococcus cellulosilyticus]GEM46595.1 hypothetical protein DC3_22300 [Deinococcus cellulosilyticus NBRC 106333 = KACC 11606]
MRSLRLASADLKDRLRSPHMILALLVMVILTGYYLPDSQATYVTLTTMNTRGIYNSAWVGVVVAILGSMLFILPGFYLVKNALDRDHRLGLWQLTLSSPIQKFTYLCSKAFSNFALLSFLTLIVAITALPLQLFRGEATGIDAAQLFLPTLFITLPSMFLVSCLAVFFEAARGLRGGAGNLVFFFLWTALVIPSLAITSDFPDPLGVAAVLKDILYGISNQPNLQEVNIGVADNLNIHTFTWTGFDWTPAYLLGRLGWMLAGILLLGWGAALYQVPHKTQHRTVSAVQKLVKDLRPMPAWLNVLRLELRIALKGIPPVLMVLAAALWAAGFVFPEVMLPLLLIAPVLVLSRLGSSAHAHQLTGVLFTTLNGEKLLFSKWCTAFLIGAALCSSVFLRLLLTGQVLEALAVLTAVLFTATLAVALGAISQNHTLFEVFYFVLWYLGAFNHWGVLDFTAVSSIPLVLLFSGGLLVFSHTLQMHRLRAGLLR